MNKEVSVFMKHYIFFIMIFSITSSISCIKSSNVEQEEYAVWNAFLDSKYAEKADERIIYEKAVMLFIFNVNNESVGEIISFVENRSGINPDSEMIEHFIQQNKSAIQLDFTMFTHKEVPQLNTCSRMSMA